MVRIVLSFLVLVMASGGAMACKCVSPNAERDATILAEATAIARVRVISSDTRRYRGAAEDRYYSTSTVEIQEIYQGTLPDTSPLTVLTPFKGTCSRLLPKDTIQEVVVYERGDDLVVKSSCSRLSKDAWDQLRKK